MEALHPPLRPPPARAQPVSSGDVFYVDPQRGSDSNSGLSVTAAFKSVQRCVDSLRGLPQATAAPPGSECRCNGFLTRTQNFSRTITISISSPRYSAPASMHLSDWTECSRRLRGGTYKSRDTTEAIFIEHLQGLQATPYVLGAYPGEKVLFDGTVDVHPHCR
jgi:hypothetical protein